MKKILITMTFIIGIFTLYSCGKKIDSTEVNEKLEKEIKTKRDKEKNIPKDKISTGKSERNIKPCCRERGKAQEIIVEDLSHWDGIFNSITVYADKIDIKDAYEEKAKRISQQEGTEVSPDQIKKDFLKERACDIISMRITKDNIEILEKKQTHDCHIDCKVLSSSKYNLIGTKTQNVENTETRWFIFEAEDDVEFKYIAFTTMYEDESLKHFHIKYAKDDIQKVIDNDTVLPTMVKSTSMISEIKKEIAR